MTQIIAIASDHGALDLKAEIIIFLQKNYPDYTVNDLGAHSTDSVDYPDYADKVAASINNDTATLGILCCGTGIGISIRANRHKHIRAALVYDQFTAKMAKAHNNANILCLGGRTTSPDLANSLIKTWLDTEFEGGRHQRRLDKLDQ